jgi:uncharacterized protein (DUF1800 family)
MSRSPTAGNDPAAHVAGELDAELAATAGSDPPPEIPRPLTSRRSFFFLGALAAASVATPAVGLAQKGGEKRKVKPAPQSLDRFPTVVANEALSPPVEWSDPISRLVRRATMGLTAEDVFRARSMGYQGWLNEQVNHTRIEDDIVNTFVLSRWPTTAQQPEEIYNIAAGTVRNELREATIYRAAFSRRQLYERMVEFWSDHFNIAIDKVGYFKVADDRDVIRAHALGRFPDLVMASARSPAMLAYLDQNRSRVGKPNENYARELMELHTLGVDGGYSQNDVVELSRVLTGWTFQGRGRFTFDPNGHDWGEKSVLGVTIPAASIAYGAEGIKEGELIIRVLTEHPNTARFIATKMLRWLLTPDPSETQIRTIASVYRSTGGDIRLMVRAILNSGWLPASPAKFKRPFHLLASGLRATNPSVSGTNTMRTQLDAMGHQLFDWETPDGFPDRIEYWAGNIITRWSFARSLSVAANATLAIDMTPYVGTASLIADAIDENFFAGEMDATMRAALISYMGLGTLNETRIRETLALAMSSSAFQWY